jgi:hypothetical protein
VICHEIEESFNKAKKGPKMTLNGVEQAMTQSTRTHAYAPEPAPPRRRTGATQAIQWELAWEYGWSVEQPPGADAGKGNDEGSNSRAALEMALALAG